MTEVNISTLLLPSGLKYSVNKHTDEYWQNILLPPTCVEESNHFYTNAGSSIANIHVSPRFPARRCTRLGRLSRLSPYSHTYCHTYHYWYSITHSLFHSRLKSFLSANPPYPSLSFFSFRFHYMDFPDCLLYF